MEISTGTIKHDPTLYPQKTKTFPEVWGGVECSVIRVRDRFHQQLLQSGHLDRISDLHLFSELGIKTLRYPIIWEMVAPDNLDTPDWTKPDEQLSKLRELGMQPIVGLLHHGSGPIHTDLTDPAFPDKLARYAGMVAERYPWITEFTPVNEPLTTARFSGLYGHWYPHGASGPVFVRCLLQQCRGIIQAMQAIRRITPEARLVFTEDMGRTFSTPLLKYQAEFENHRRWLSLDLLFGKVTQEHPLWIWLLQNGASREELEYFITAPTPPDTVGMNYYVTSDRLLDERLQLYPLHTHGGNGRHTYADVEAARAWNDGIIGHEELLVSAWQRYGQTVALTEVHLGCTREEQLRWFQEAWQAAVNCRNRGIDVRAVTVWSLLGAFDWDTMMTEAKGSYETGVFDLRGPQPRPTALAGMIRNLAKVGRFDHPCLGSPGWWRRPERYLPTCKPSDPAPTNIADQGKKQLRPVLVIGKTGTLGRAFARLCESRALEFVILSREDIDIASYPSVARALAEYQPWAVINAAGFVRVDEAEVDQQRCFRENTQGPMVIAAACADRGIKMITFSSDQVFDGGKGAPYLESDLVAPLNIYGRSKAEAESQVLSILPEALVIRTSAFFGPWDQHNFVSVTLAQLAKGQSVMVSTDLISPTYVPDLVNASLDLLLDHECGIWHVSNTGGALTWAELAYRCAHMAKLHPAIIPQSAETSGLLARRPPAVVLASERAALLPSLDDALHRYFLNVGSDAAV